MSSPLDGRIRSVAREEVAAALGSSPAAPADSADADRVAALEKEVVSLWASVKSLTNRLDALAKTPTDVSPETRPAARRARKADSE
ncbi:hypothetical protein [Streptomyces sp. YKOK-I1]